MEGVLKLFKPCPICGHSDVLDITFEESYNRIYMESGCACVAIHCQRCSLDLYEHTDSIKVYDDKVRRLAEVWNGMPRRDDNA